jgi:hypothetical protein
MQKVYIPSALMQISSQLIVVEDLRRLPSRAMTYTELEDLLTARRDHWQLTERPSINELIRVIEEHELLQIAEIASDGYGRKTRYALGKVSLLQLASSFYKGSYLSHGTALQVHGLASSNQVFVNHEQSPKGSGSRLSQSGLDRAFKSPQRQSNYIFRYGSRTITFLNGKNTERAGVIEMQGDEHESLQVTNLERTLIDVIVRPQYAGGIRNVIKCFEKAMDRISIDEIATLLARTDYVYPYHQAIGFVLQKVGLPEESLSPLKARKVRFRFYLDYAMKNPAFDPAWKLYYPGDI